MHRDALAYAAVGLGAALIAVSGLGWWLSPTQPRTSGPQVFAERLSSTPPAGGAITKSRSALPYRSLATSALATSRAPGEGGGLPTELRVPSLDITASVALVDTGGSRTLIPPNDYTTVGWWSAGARPGARHGTAILAGHTVHTGGGAFDDLELTAAGDKVIIEGTRGRVVYRVASVSTYRKGTLAQESASVFAQRGESRVALVTCENWNGEMYLSNLVVIATHPRISQRDLPNPR